MGTFNSTLFMVEILATIVFFIGMQTKVSANEEGNTSKKADSVEESNEFKKAA